MTNIVSLRITPSLRKRIEAIRNRTRPKPSLGAILRMLLEKALEK